MNTGIDYGFKATNIDVKTGIRYGVLPQNDIFRAWVYRSVPEYANCCPYCGNEPRSGNDIHEMKQCPSCHKMLEDGDFDGEEAIAYVLDDGKYKAFCDDGDIFIIKSLYFTYAQFCSPCAPGACHLRNPFDPGDADSNNKCYCFGPEWFDGGVAPYPVFRVSDGSEVVV